MNNALDRHEARLRDLGCLVCRRILGLITPPELHHIATGSGARSPWAVVPLCAEHHRGATGLHGLSARSFVSRYRIPGETEYGLFVWLLEDLARVPLWKN